MLRVFIEEDVLKVRRCLVPSCCFFSCRIIVLETRKHSAVEVINISERREPRGHLFFLRSQATSRARRLLIRPDGGGGVGPAFLHGRPGTRRVERSRELIHLLLSSFPLRFGPALQSNEVTARQKRGRAIVYECDVVL